MRTFRLQSPLGILALLLLIVSAVYAPVAWFDFVHWDDADLVFQNPIVTTVNMASIWKAFTSYDPELYIPFTLFSYQLERFIFGLNPAIFHSTNVVLHLCNTILLYLTTRRIFSSQWLAIATVSVWALHPLHIETVAWISARKDLLSTLFFLGSLLSFLHFEAQSTKRWYVLSILLFVCALLSKVTAIALPLLIATYLCVLCCCSYRDRALWSKLTPYIVASVVFGFIAYMGKAHAFNMDLAQHILLTIKSIGFTLQQTVLPLYQSIAYEQVAPLTLMSTEMLWWLCVVSMFVGLIIWGVRSGVRLATFGSIWFIIALLPTLTSFVHDPFIFYAFDRYAYVPSIGIIIALLALLQHLTSVHRYVLPACITLICGLFVWGTSSRIGVWQNTAVLYHQAFVHSPDSLVIQHNLVWHYQVENPDSDQLQKYIDAASSYRGFAEGYNAVGLKALQEGDVQEAIALYEKGISLYPTLANLLNNYGRALGIVGRFEESLCIFKRVQQLDAQFIADPVLFDQLLRFNSPKCSALQHNFLLP